ncbi:outer membrane lipoprotein carrier protein LolA [Flavobacteriaceae bacterium F89]|uniref:Outer membrane lipoprotein carrier protein LolA n=1 Tax=Cerina litoralis TaxID=2874477 RepID=A0AAE3JNQ9_9FLAO|nr:outer membrane lipoprotein carrier protein LolA [Cerina litoralis]MCG2460171.1 outer membrane lipoprotein carrier protein LolA [Cerina litoralis]
MRNLIYPLFFFVLGVGAQTKMEITEANALREKVMQHAAATNTLSVDFVQTKHLGFLSNDIITKGKLAFKTPNLVKWEYTDPFQYSILFKDGTMYVDDEGNKSQMDMGGSKLFEQLNQLIVNSVKGDMFQEDEFYITYFKKGNDNEVHFVPKNKNLSKYIKAFHLVFNPKGEVIQVRMIEPSDDYTQITFSHRTVNKPLPDAVFDH